MVIRNYKEIRKENENNQLWKEWSIAKLGKDDYTINASKGVGFNSHMDAMSWCCVSETSPKLSKVKQVE